MSKLTQNTTQRSIYKCLKENEKLCIFSKVLENIVIVGCGDGNILAYDLDNGQCLYGYGVD